MPAIRTSAHAMPPSDDLQRESLMRGNRQARKVVEHSFRRATAPVPRLESASIAYQREGVDPDAPAIALSDDEENSQYKCPICPKHHIIRYNKHDENGRQSKANRKDDHLGMHMHVERVAELCSIDPQRIRRHFPYKCLHCNRYWYRDHLHRMHVAKCPFRRHLDTKVKAIATSPSLSPGSQAPILSPWPVKFHRSPTVKDYNRLASGMELERIRRASKPSKLPEATLPNYKSFLEPERGLSRL
ncbi:hypothetical protein BC835DRAFT_266963 [Cytidiella melzeri]|nr:hypothetical protein BC835DRAFT_266963 [Cytidiella melzeri]